jgi:hypothetical protein
MYSYNYNWKRGDHMKTQTYVKKKGITPSRVMPQVAAFLLLILLMGSISQPPETGIPESGKESSIDDIVAYLRGLPIDEFVAPVCVGTLITDAHACTVFTASVGDTVLFGNNEDHKDQNTRIWFIPASEAEYGRVYVGYSNYSAQGGMNDQGLCYDATAVPESKMNPHPEKLQYMGNFCELILKKCATVEEAIELIDLYDLSNIGRGQFLFADRTGDSMIVGAGKDGEVNIIHSSATYQVITNFVVANRQLGRYPCWRYTTAVAMLEKIETEDDLTVEYFASILDAVHLEGTYSTIYSTVYDAMQKRLYLYHEHNFDDAVIFNLEDELQKGYHSYDISKLFSPIRSSRNDSTSRNLTGSAYQNRYIMGSSSLYRGDGGSSSGRSADMEETKIKLLTSV